MVVPQQQKRAVERANLVLVAAAPCQSPIKACISIQATQHRCCLFQQAGDTHKGAGSLVIHGYPLTALQTSLSWESACVHESALVFLVLLRQQVMTKDHARKRAKVEVEVERERECVCVHVCVCACVWVCMCVCICVCMCVCVCVCVCVECYA